eukprot:TRINITY_DN9531_c0_g1_i9.p4 TRINITY_DN9531_c0_g1~~TRINITY_DN9531_c0_g1_i9.p4  ORF type:complete len:163 (+),score=14.92 TRINITY_DN9531_c0_g1_i9:276-764(+)
MLKRPSSSTNLRPIANKRPKYEDRREEAIQLLTSSIHTHNMVATTPLHTQLTTNNTKKRVGQKGYLEILNACFCLQNWVAFCNPKMRTNFSVPGFPTIARLNLPTNFFNLDQNLLKGGLVLNSHFSNSHLYDQKPDYLEFAVLKDPNRIENIQQTRAQQESL